MEAGWSDERPNDHDRPGLPRDRACPSCGHLPAHAHKCRATLGSRILYAIRLPDGGLITDPEWESVGDVMRGAHGHADEQMPGDLVTYEAEIACPCRCPVPGVYV